MEKANPASHHLSASSNGKNIGTGGCRGLGWGLGGARVAVAMTQHLCGMKLRQAPSCAISSVSKTLPLVDKEARVLRATSHN